MATLCAAVWLPAKESHGTASQESPTPPPGSGLHQRVAFRTHPHQDKSVEQPCPPPPVIKGEHRLGLLVIDKVAGQLAASFPINQIASEVHDALARARGWAEVRACIASARTQGTFWGSIDLPALPTLGEVHRYARDRLAQTSSLDNIAVRARERLLELVYARLSHILGAKPAD